MGKTKKLTIDVVDETDIVGWLTSATTWDEIAVTSVKSMVRKVIARANANGGGRRSIFRLNIYGHGRPGLQSIGDGRGNESGKNLSDGNVHNFNDSLVTLKPYFRKDAIVTLHGCKTGKGKEGTTLLKHLANILGVPVQAGMETQYPLVPGMEGDIKRCTPVRCTKHESTWIGTPD
jgi:hypothetical protein